MKEIFELERKIVPELLDVLVKRYNILRAISHHQPVGRRSLAEKLSMGERTIRTEIEFLKSQELVEIRSNGMIITEEGRALILKLKETVHEIKGISELERQVENLLHIKKVIIVPGDISESQIALRDLGKACANFVKGCLKDNCIIALTGGSTLREVVEAFPKDSHFKNIQVLPARGGMGENVETQSNTLAALLAKKVEGTYKMLHIPDTLSNDIIENLFKEEPIKSLVETIHKADIIMYGIGNAEQMVKKRGLSETEVQKLIQKGAVGEACGCYFSKDSKIISETTAIGIKISSARKINVHIAVAGGNNKVESIIATEFNDTDGILVTDEAAAKGIIRKFLDSEAHD